MAGALEAIFIASEKLAINRERSGTPLVSCTCCNHSAFSRATSTLDGHSDLHPLQERQRSIAAATSSLSNGLALVERVRTSRKMFARARVVSCSFRVAMKLGHIVPPIRSLLRPSPHPFHPSPPPTIPPLPDKLP